MLERFLVERLHKARDRDPAVQYAIDTIGASGGATSIAAIVERTGFSARRFISTFRDEVGLPPKVFCRLARFRRVILRSQSVGVSATAHVEPESHSRRVNFLQSPPVQGR